MDYSFMNEPMGISSTLTQHKVEEEMGEGMKRAFAAAKASRTASPDSGIARHGMLAPPVSLLVKLGSIAVHADEMLSSDGHAFDRVALQSLLTDPEVIEWIKKMDAAAMTPKKRRG